VHADLLQRALACTLDLRPRIAARDPTLEAWCGQVRAITGALGFGF
jgi:glutamate-ammonia-ligase adenylyltransferase